MLDTAIILRGGLGNQLFQFTCARNTQLMTRSALSINNTIGFYLDRRYRRKYELDGLVHGDLLNNHTPFRRLFISEKMSNRISSKVGSSFSEYSGYQMIHDSHSTFVDIKNSICSEKVFLSGYWQSHLYFKENASKITREIANWVAEALGELDKSMFNNCQRQQSVAVGIRTYSESRNPNFHSRDGKQKSITEWQSAINEALLRLEDPVFYLFTTDREEIIKNLNFNRARTILVDQDSIKSSRGRMLAIAACKNHIFNNSSFYWWSAYLSPHLFERKQGLVLVSNNFLNVNSYLQSWRSF